MLTGTQNIDIEQRTGGYVNGVWTINTVAVKSIVASVQHGTGKTVQALPEGHRGQATLIVWTLEPLTPFTTNTIGDVVLWQGNRYRVNAVKYWPCVLSHYECLCSLWDTDIEGGA